MSGDGQTGAGRRDEQNGERHDTETGGTTAAPGAGSGAVGESQPLSWAAPASVPPPTGSPWGEHAPYPPANGAPPAAHPSGQTPGAQAPQGQPAFGENPYGQPAFGQNPYGQPAYGQSPYGQPAYGQSPYAPPPGGGGWTPPPKPGLIPLRPLGFGTLLGAPFQALRRNPKATFGSAMLVQGVVVVLTALVLGGVTFFVADRIASAAPEDRDAITAGSILAIVLAALIPLAVSLVGTVMVQGVVVAEVARATLGEKLTLGRVWRAAAPRLGTLILWTVVSGIAILVAIAVVVGIVWAIVATGTDFLGVGIAVAILCGLGLVVLFAWLSTKLAIVPSVIVLERASLSRAVSRSWSLTRGYFWRTLGVLFLVAMILSIASQVVTTPITLLMGIGGGLIDPTASSEGAALVTFVVTYILLILVTLVVTAVTSVVQAAAVALVYIDLRMRHEGLDLDLVRFVEARQTGDGSVPDPFPLPAGRRGSDAVGASTA